MALANDSSVDLPHFLATLRRTLQGVARMDPSKLDAVITPDKQKDNINAILAAIEAKDPTPNKEYTQWLARKYALGGPPGYALKIEDINRNDLLRLFQVAKKRRMIKPEHADINRFKTYLDFENTMRDAYNNFEELETEHQPEGTAKKVYNDENVTIVVPEDEAAACKYGRNTRWCTASTRGHNMFDAYNRQGKLYILIPKKPKYEGEKYQVHFASNSYMDENDDPVNGMWLLQDRFPGLKEFFVQVEPELKDKIVFAPDAELQQAIESVAELAQDKIWETVSDWEMQDDSYYSYLRDEGYVDENGDIDWDKVEQAQLTYSEYNPEVERWSRDMWENLTPSPEQIRDLFEDDPYEYSNWDNMKYLPDVIGTMLREKYRGRRDEGDANIGQWLREKVSMKKEGDRWQAYVVPSLRLPR